MLYVSKNRKFWINHRPMMANVRITFMVLLRPVVPGHLLEHPMVQPFGSLFAPFALEISRLNTSWTFGMRCRKQWIFVLLYHTLIELNHVQPNHSVHNYILFHFWCGLATVLVLRNDSASAVLDEARVTKKLVSQG